MHKPPRGYPNWREIRRQKGIPTPLYSSAPDVAKVADVPIGIRLHPDGVKPYVKPDGTSGTEVTEVTEVTDVAVGKLLRNSMFNDFKLDSPPSALGTTTAVRQEGIAQLKNG